MNLIQKLDDWYKEWSGVSHLEHSNQPIHDSAAAQDFAEYCIKEYVGMKDTRLAELEAQGWKWWVEWDVDYNRGWAYKIWKEINPCRGVEQLITCDNFITKSDAEKACVEYILNIRENSEEQTQI